MNDELTVRLPRTVWVVNHKNRKVSIMEVAGMVIMMGDGDKRECHYIPKHNQRFGTKFYRSDEVFFSMEELLSAKGAK